MKPQSRFDFSRQDKVRKAIMREVSDVLHRLLQQNPDFTDPIVSITDVEVSGDLQHAKIFLSIFGDPELQKSIMAYVQEITPKVRYELGQRVRLRLTPEILFRMDDSIERGTRVTDILNQLRDGEL